MNQKQMVALEVLCRRITRERNFHSQVAETNEVTPIIVTPETCKWEIEPLSGKALVTLPIENFPVVSIGKQGGYDMPAIKSYPQENGLTALDACVYGDWHLAKQNGGRKKGRVLPYTAQVAQ